MKNEHQLRNVVEHMQAQGAVNIRVVKHPRRVMLIGDLPPAGRLSHTLHNIRNVGTWDEQDQRLARWLGQYRHWLEWVFITQRKAGESAE